MNLSQLYYFRKLAELQHYTKSAKELFITQPTLSGSISSLEQELGVSLFQKAGRNVELTKYGAEFLTYVNSALEQLDKGVAIMKGYAGESDGGTIDMGAIITIQTDFLPRMLMKYQGSVEHEHDFNISQAPTEVLLEGLVKGTHDVVFAACDPEMPQIEYIPLLEQQLVIAMQADNPLAQKEYLTAADLEDVTLLSYRDQVPIGRAIKEMASKLGINHIKHAFEDESILAGFVASANEVALLLDTFFLRNIEGIVIKPFLSDEETKRKFVHTIYMAYSNKNYHPYCVDTFIEFIANNRLVKDEETRIYID